MEIMDVVKGEIPGQYQGLSKCNDKGLKGWLVLPTTRGTSGGDENGLLLLVSPRQRGKGYASGMAWDQAEEDSGKHESLATR